MRQYKLLVAHVLKIFCIILKYHFCALRLTQRRQECSGSAETLKKMETEFDWIVREKDNLGRGE